MLRPLRRTSLTCMERKGKKGALTNGNANDSYLFPTSLISPYIHSLFNAVNNFGIVILHTNILADNNKSKGRE